MSIELANELVQWRVDTRGRVTQLTNRRTGAQHAVPAPLAALRTPAGDVEATAAAWCGDVLSLQFGVSGAQVDLGITVLPRYFVIEVLAVQGTDIEALTFLDVRLAEAAADQLTGCVLALNLQTNVPEIPGPQARLRALCYKRFGLAGARAAVILGPPQEMRRILQEAVSAAPDLPHSPLGGPWAMDAPANRGSYLFNFTDLSEERADDWIGLARTLGLNQIDFHGGRSFRFGDCAPDPDTYPNGLASMRAVTDRLHAAGIQAGLHTYAFFIDKRCPWVTPVPDARLARDATFTLAQPLTATAQTVPVAEPTAGMSATTGFFVRNSVTLHVDDELITYAGVSREPPFAFTSCERGACGTRPAAHARGAAVHHLKECFGLFVPDGESTLFGEVAERTARAFNEGGFDMMYLDALDGEDVVGGGESGWHYGSKFVFEIWRHLERPALMEMSTFHHHLWYVRSRMGAWDHPARSHKTFIDIHCSANQGCRRMLLPAHLGWWAFRTWSSAQEEPTFPDDIEYLGAKCLGSDTGLSIMGVDPATIDDAPALRRLAGILSRYEGLRHAGLVPESIKEQLRVPAAEFALRGSAQDGWAFRPVHALRHKVESLDRSTAAWTFHNPHPPQPAQARLEALLTAGPYGAADNVVLVDPACPGMLAERDAAAEVDMELATVPAPPGLAGEVLCCTATNRGRSAAGAWARAGRVFSPALDLSAHQGLGLWLHGDGSGALLNVQLRSPESVSGAIGEHYMRLDFRGWRYQELIEPEGARYADHTWPYGSMYSIYRELVDYSQVERLDVWLNDVPAGGQARCFVSAIKAIPLHSFDLVRPQLTIAGQTALVPVTMQSGMYLELTVDGCGRLYGRRGEEAEEAMPAGPIPRLASGANEVSFSCEAPATCRPRAYVRLAALGAELTHGATASGSRDPAGPE